MEGIKTKSKYTRVNSDIHQIIEAHIFRSLRFENVVKLRSSGQFGPKPTQEKAQKLVGGQWLARV